MKLSTILILSFILLGLVGSVAGTYYYYSQSNELLEERVIADLESTAAALENFINEVLEEQGEKLEIAATHGDLTNEELKKIVDLQEEFYEIFVLDSSGKIIASSDESQIGTDKSGDSYFVEGKKNTYLKSAYLSESTQKESIAVATPFNEGVLVARIELQSFDRIVSDRTGLGETGEALLAYRGEDGEPIFFTELRFSSSSSSSRPIDVALAGEEKLVLGSFDYRDVEVIAVTRYIEKIDIGMVVKIDEAEALGIARNQLIKTSIIIIIAILISFSIAGFIIAKLIAKPLKKMTADVEEITKGKLDLQLSRSSISEVQRLTDSLNRILASLKLAILKTGTSKSEIGIEEVISAKNKAEEGYQSLYKSSEDAMMKLEPPTWNFTAGNPATIKIFNVKDEKEFVSLGPQDLSPEKQPDGQLSSGKAKEMIMKAMKEGSNSFDWTHKRYKGEDFAAHVLLTKIKSGGKEYLQATVTDLTKNAESNEKSKKKVVGRLVEAAEPAITKTPVKKDVGKEKIPVEKLVKKPVEKPVQVEEVKEEEVKPVVKKKVVAPIKKSVAVKPVVTKPVAVAKPVVSEESKEVDEKVEDIVKKLPAKKTAVEAKPFDVDKSAEPVMKEKIVAPMKKPIVPVKKPVVKKLPTEKKYFLKEK